MAKRPTSFRISDRSLRLLKRLADHLDTTQTAVLERALRVLAKQEGVVDEQGENRGQSG